MTFRHLPARVALAALLAATPALAQEKPAVLLPAIPTPVELAELPPETFLRQQMALKKVWLERLIRTREERHRTTRDNVAASTLQAQKLGAPAAFVSLLRRQAMGSLPARERHELNSALLALLTAYGVSNREMLFFVEESPLSASQLRDVVSWLPLDILFNTLPTADEAPTTVDDAARHYGELLATRREYASALQNVVDTASANAAAEALLPTLERSQSTLRHLLVIPEHLHAAARAPHAREEDEVNAATQRARARMQEHAWFGSHRLQVLESLLY